MVSRNTAVGAWGEDVALRHLTAAGLELVERNWRCEFGEVDLVMREGDVAVVCEVKTRTSTVYGTPHQAVTEVKAARLRRLAARWASEQPGWVPEVRIDLVAVLRPLTGPSVVEHVRGVC